MTKSARRRLARLIAGLVVGAAAGLVVYAVTRVTGPVLFVITGGTAGAASALLIQLYGRTTELSEVKVAVPQFSELTFVVNNDSRRVAWKLFVESSTRVSTQSLDDESGLIREAMNSLYGLFSTTREVLKAAQPSRGGDGPTVEYFAVAMLNRELRPFLSKWHPRLRAFETANPSGPESRWEDNLACRQDLREVQGRLQEYALGFARLAGVADAESILSAGT